MSFRTTFATRSSSEVLKGEELAQAYANMDVFLFPSRTETFGNVVLEATASGVPGVATTSGGPKFLISSGVNGVTADRATRPFCAGGR